MANYRPWIAGLVLILSGCGGSSGDPDSDPIGLPPPIHFDVYEAQWAELQATWGSTSISDPATLPMSGTASYAGVLRLDMENAAGEVSVDGKLNLSVSFADNNITGTANKFVDPNDARYLGELTLSNGFLDRAADPAVDYTFNADLTGTLIGGGDVYDLNAGLSGDFLGPGQGAVSGQLAGSADSSFGSGYLFGEFVAQQ